MGVARRSYGRTRRGAALDLQLFDDGAVGRLLAFVRFARIAVGRRPPLALL